MAVGFVLTKDPGESFRGKSVEQINEYCSEQLERSFMTSFMEHTKAAVQYSFGKALEEKRKVVEELHKA